MKTKEKNDIAGLQKEKKYFTFSDFSAMCRFSLRNFFWRVDGEALIKETGWGVIVVAVILTLLELGIVWDIVSRVIRILLFDTTIFDLLDVLVSEGPLALVIFLIFFNVRRLRYCFLLSRSVWWKNTGIPPSEIIKDKGIYGEFLSTMAVEDNLRIHKKKGIIINSAIIPKADENFNEIDLLCITESGIHVIETKARQGHFSGSLTGSKWSRYGQEIQNPIIQNLVHCNTLAEYLYKELPECALKHKDLSALMVNVVMYSLDNFNAYLDKTVMPNRFAFCRAESFLFREGYQTKDLTKAFGKVLTDTEIDLIGSVLMKTMDYTPEERLDMFQRRAVMGDNGAFWHPKIYFGVRGLFPDIEGKKLKRETICCDNGYWRTYYNEIDGLFRAIPDAEIIQRTDPFPDKESAMNAFYHSRQNMYFK